MSSDRNLRKHVQDLRHGSDTAADEHEVEPNVPAVCDAQHDATHRHAVEVECIQQVCLQPFTYVLAGPIGAVLLLVVMYNQVSHRAGLRWLAALIAARAAVRLLALRFGREAAAGRTRRRMLYLSSESLQGLVWSAAPFVLHVREPRYEMFTIITLVVVATMSSLTMAPFLTAAAAFTVPIAAVLSIWLVRRGDLWGRYAAAGSIAIYAMSLYHARFTNGELKRAITSRREIVRLAAQLELAKARAESANAELQARNDRLREIARRDPLTGLFNRRHFIEWLDRVRRRDAVTRPWFLAILDADHFKRFNDEFGHQVGDQVLISIANAALGEIRWTDCFARIGGEEFGLLLQDVTFEDAVAIVERVRKAVAAIDLGVGHITLSVGLLAGEQDIDAAVALTRADDALYEAKRTGRNRLVCAPSFSQAKSATLKFETAVVLNLS